MSAQSQDEPKSDVHRLFKAFCSLIDRIEYPNEYQGLIHMNNGKVFLHTRTECALFEAELYIQRKRTTEVTQP